MFILHSDQFKPKSYLKVIKKYVFSEGEQFPVNAFVGTPCAQLSCLASLQSLDKVGRQFRHLSTKVLKNTSTAQQRLFPLVSLSC